MRSGLIASTLVSLVIGQQTGQSTSAGPTLEETASWLSSNLVGVHESHQRTTEKIDPKKGVAISKSRKVFQTETAIIQARLDKCQLTVVEKMEDSTSLWSSTDTTIYAVPLNYVRSVEIKSVDRRKSNPDSDKQTSTFVPATYTDVRVAADREVIIWTSKGTLSGQEPTNDQGVSKVWGFASDDPILAQRLSRALSRAVDLCRASAKSEPF